jgi:hypothetical protein
MLKPSVASSFSPTPAKYHWLCARTMFFTKPMCGRFYLAAIFSAGLARTVYGFSVYVYRPFTITSEPHFQIINLIFDFSS